MEFVDLPRQMGVSDQSCDIPRCFGLHARDYVSVLLEGEGRALVAEALADHLNLNSSSECDSCVGMPEVVKPDLR